jgi:hypothetical protein
MLLEFCVLMLIEQNNMYFGNHCHRHCFITLCQISFAGTTEHYSYVIITYYIDDLQLTT